MPISKVSAKAIKSYAKRRRLRMSDKTAKRLKILAKDNNMDLRTLQISLDFLIEDARSQRKKTILGRHVTSLENELAILSIGIRPHSFRSTSKGTIEIEKLKPIFKHIKGDYKKYGKDFFKKYPKLDKNLLERILKMKD